MSTNNRQQPTSEGRSRRMELRERRQRELQLRKKRKWILRGFGIAAGVFVLALGIFLVLRLAGGTSISAKGETFVIALDPGHGGEDTGLTGAFALEKDIAFKICSKLTIMLESQGYEVVVTREEDTRISKEERAAFANESGADLLVSVHCNYSEDDASLLGATSSYQDGSRKSKALAENIQTALIAQSGAKDGGVKIGNYTILNDAEMPAVLIEVGYLSNDAEAENLADDVYQNDLAKGIAQGIIASLNRE